jgi:hypothetical protein
MTTLPHLLFSVAAVLLGFASVLPQGLRVVRLFNKICCTYVTLPVKCWSGSRRRRNIILKLLSFLSPAAKCSVANNGKFSN